MRSVSLFVFSLLTLLSKTFGQGSVETNLWTYTAEQSLGSPTFGPDGAVIFTSDRGLVCLNSDGSERWRYDEEFPVLGIPSVGPDGVVYCGIYNGFMGAWDTNGTNKWKFKANGLVLAPPALGRDGTIYFTSGDWKIYAVTPEGDEKWSQEIFCTGAVPPSIGGDGTIYAIGENDLIAISPGGEILWRVSANGQATTAPAVGADGTIYFGAYGKEFNACSPSGEKLWKFVTSEAFGRSSPVVSSDGTVFAAAGRTLYALRPNGTKKWQYNAPSDIESTPSIAADGTIYFNSYEREFFALKPDGQLKWKLNTEYRVADSPAMNHVGILLIPQYLSLKAIQTDSPLDNGPWPTLQQDPQRIGRAFLLPTITLLSPAQRIDLDLGDSFDLAAEALSPNGSISRIEFWAGDQLIGTVSNAPFTFQWTNATAGIHQVFARAFDEIGANSASPKVQMNIAPLGSIPSFTIQPVSQIVSNNLTVELSADAFGSAPITFQWLKDGVEIPAATNTSLTLSNVTLLDSAFYAVLATNAFGSTLSTQAVVSVLQPVTVKWSADDIGSTVSPAISEGTRIITGAGNAIQVNGPSGQFLWNCIVGEIGAPPSVGLDGSIYVSSRDGKFHSVSEDGSIQWTNPTNGWNEGAAAIGTDGTVYVAGDTNLLAYSPAGSVLWRSSITATAFASPSIGQDGTIFIGTLARYLHDQARFSSWFYAVSPDGTTKWRSEFTNDIVSSSAISTHGDIIFGVTDGRMYSYSTDGTKNWEFRSDGPVRGSPVISADGTIYIGGEGPRNGAQIPGRLYALTPDGALKWKYSFRLGITGAPAIAADGTIYVGDRAGDFVALNPNGTLKWELRTDWTIPGSPVIGFDGTVYFVNSNRKLFAIDGGSPPQRSAWPMFQRDVKRTGNAGAPFDSDKFFYPFSSNAFDDQVHRIVRGADDRMYVGGDFRIAGGVPANHIAEWNGSRWASLGDGVDDRVLAIASDMDNVYVGGFFRRAGETNANYVARWDGAQWHAMGEGFREYIYDLELRAGQVLAAGGYSINGGFPGSCVNIWDGEQWHPLGDNLNGVVFDILLDGTNIFIGGGDNLWKIDDPVSSVAQWDGTRWVSVGQIFGYAGTLTRYRGELCVGGERLTGNTPNAALGALARWNGTQWESFGGLSEGRVSTLVADGDHLYVGGYFTNIGGILAQRVARFDGTNWTSFAGGVSGALPRSSSTVNSILPDGDRMFIGGVFTRAGASRDIFHFAEWNSSDWSSFGPMLHFVDGRFTFTLSDALGQSYGIETSTDFKTWSRVASYTNLTHALQFVDDVNSTNTAKKFYRAVSP